MLLDERAAVDGDNRHFINNLEYLAREFVLQRLIVSGHNDAIREHEVICVGGRQAVAIVIVYGVRQWHCDCVERTVIAIGEFMDVAFHSFEGLVMLVVVIDALDVDNLIVWSESG